MPNEVLRKTKVEYLFRSASYAATGNNILSSGSPTGVNLSLASTSDGAAKNSDKLDLGATRPQLIHIMACLQWFAAVTAGRSVDFWWAGSAHSSAAVGNPGEADGTDGAYTGSGDGGTTRQGVRNMRWIGNMITETHTAGHAQKAYIGSFPAEFRYGQLVVFNDSGVTLCGTNDIQTSVLAYGTIDELQ